MQYITEDNTSHGFTLEPEHIILSIATSGFLAFFFGLGLYFVRRQYELKSKFCPFRIILFIISFNQTDLFKNDIKTTSDFFFTICTFILNKTTTAV